MELKKIIFKVEEGVANIQLNYIKNFNAIDESMADELEYCLEKCKSDEVKVVLITGSEKCFSAGGDIAYFYDKVKKDDIGDFKLVERVFDISDTIRKLPKPVVAACSGAVAGAGCNLALSCDLVLVSSEVKFIQAFVNIGLIPDTGGAFLLAKDIGWHKTMDLILTGRPLLAQEGFDLGLFYKVVELKDLKEETHKLVKKLAGGPLVSYANSKALIYEAVFKHYRDFGKVESKGQVECSKTDDFKEGISSFMEKRAAEFKGR
ncbi:enoyl-CoA hydratase/isomerase family protein [Peptoniphilaceae bacterium SGI.131]